MDLEQVLNGEDAPEVAPEAVETEQAQPEKAESEPLKAEAEESGEEATGLDEGDELPSSEQEQPAGTLEEQLENTRKELNAYKAKARDEKTKRQQAEASLQGKPEPVQQQELPDPLDDPAGYAAAVQRMADNRYTQRVLISSHKRAQRKYGSEYEAKMEAAGTWLAQTNPEIRDSVLFGDDPVEDAIVEYEKHTETEKLKDPNYIAQLTEKARQEGYEKAQAELKRKADEVSGISPSLAKAGSSEVGAHTWSGPTPLTNILQ